MGVKIFISERSVMKGEYDLDTMPTYMLPILIDGIQNGNYYQYIKDKLPAIQEEFHKRIKTHPNIKFRVGDTILINWGKKPQKLDMVVASNFVHTYKIIGLQQIRFNKDDTVSDITYTMVCTTGKLPSKQVKIYKLSYLEKLEAVKVSETIDKDLMRALYG